MALKCGRDALLRDPGVLFGLAATDASERVPATLTGVVCLESHVLEFLVDITKMLLERKKAI
jgi:hypothetical protein